MSNEISLLLDEIAEKDQRIAELEARKDRKIEVPPRGFGIAHLPPPEHKESDIGKHIMTQKDTILKLEERIAELEGSIVASYLNRTAETYIDFTNDQEAVKHFVANNNSVEPPKGDNHD